MTRRNSGSSTAGSISDFLHPDEQDLVATSPTYEGPPMPIPPPIPPPPHHEPSRSKYSLHSTRSTRARASSQASRPPHQSANLTPKQKFRTTVRKVMAMHRTSTAIGVRAIAGAEPGINVNTTTAEIDYGWIKQDCVIQVIDYSAVRSSFGRMTNKEFVGIMDDSAASAREPWVKVRWINIHGISWDVIKAVSNRYDLHPLALEDIFHTRSQTRSKADYYLQHLFIRILGHELLNTDHDDSPPIQWAEGSTLTDDPMPLISNSSDPDSYEMVQREDGEPYGSTSSLKASASRRERRRRAPILPQSAMDANPQAVPPKAPVRSKTASTMRQFLEQFQQQSAMQPISADDLKVAALKRGERVNVKVDPMYIFLLRDGTVISLSSNPTEDFTAPIVARLKQRDTGLRSSADPSLLVHSLLDLVVDKALEVIDAYHAKIKKFEGEVLLKPKMRTVRNLHILSGDLILHKRTLDPIKTLVLGLRKYDLDRATAIIDTTDSRNKDVKPQGWMSHKTKIYLADVFDHMEYILTSLDMFTGIAENLIDYTFNMASHEMNQVMRRLTTATIVFLPLTLCTGYFGMNFEIMYSVQGKSEWIFWWTAIIVSALIVPAFIYPDIISAIHYVQKSLFARKLAKTLKVA